MPNNFYSVHDFIASEGALNCTIHYDAAHPIFEGHFPGNPIVPGVCTMQMMGELLSRALGMNIRLTEAASIKYLQLITPDLRPHGVIAWTISEGIITANATLKDGAQTLFKMSGRYLAD